MMTDKWLEADWDSFALGALDAGTQREMQSHLRSGCSACRRSYEAAVATMTALGATAPLVEPSPGIADALLKRIAERSGQSGQVSSTATGDAKVVSIRQTPIPAQGRRSGMGWLPWSIAALFALLALWFGVRLQQVEGTARVAPPQAPPPTKMQPVQPAVQEPKTPLEVTPASSERATEQAAVADRAEAQALKRQLAQAEADRDRAVAQALEAQKELSAAVAERGTLQAQLASAQEQARKAVAVPAGKDESRDAEARLAALTHDLDRANATIAGLRAVTARDGQVLAFLREGPTRQIDLRGIDSEAGQATGVAYYSPDRGLLLLTRNLPPLQAGKCYQLWSTHKSGAAVQSVGLIQTDAAGTGYLYARASTDLRQLTGLAITDEPSGGSVSARGHKLLFGVLN